MTEPMIEVALRRPTTSFTLDLHFRSNARILGIFGPSGSGKTTCLEAIAGLRSDLIGTVRCRGMDWLRTEKKIRVAPEKRRVGYVPQDHRLFPHWNVRKNLGASLDARQKPKEERSRRFEEVVELLELKPFLERSVEPLSGGQKQRVALGRALLSEPTILLLDEPMASLDGALRARILPYLREAVERFTCPMLIVSHQPQDLLALCDEVVALESGKAIRQGAPVEVLTNRNVYRHFARDGIENMLPAAMLGTSLDSVTLALGNPASNALRLTIVRPDPLPQGRFFIGLPARDLIIATAPTNGLSARNQFPFRLRSIEKLDHHALIRGEIGNGPTGLPDIAVELTHEAVDELNLCPGREVFLLFKSSAVRVYC
jgi:molybdate transport system ATP-binding protein